MPPRAEEGLAPREEGGLARKRGEPALLQRGEEVWRPELLRARRRRGIRHETGRGSGGIGLAMGPMQKKV